MEFRDFLFKGRLPILNRGLDAYSLRQRVIAENIANATSPHYRPQEVKFEEYFNEAEASTIGAATDSRHIPLGKKNSADVEAETTEAALPAPEIYFAGQSHVNIDKEMSELAQNQIKYRFATQMVKGYFQGLSSAIRGISQ